MTAKNMDVTRVTPLPKIPLHKNWCNIQKNDHMMAPSKFLWFLHQVTPILHKTAKKIDATQRLVE
jgi:hypothetical protein